MPNEHFDTAIIGGGQAGLAAAYHVKQRGRTPVVLDENERVGDSWRTRWDSLRLFTPAQYDGLPGWRFPAPRWSFPTKDEMADYMESYVARFGLDVRTGVRIDRVSKRDGRFVIEAGASTYEADNVIVATGSHRVPRLPDFARDLDPRILQLHSSEYRSPAQLREGPVLIVGFGNSGAEIGAELVRTRPAWVSGKPYGEIPVPHGSRRFRVAFRVLRFFWHRVLTRSNPLGRKLGPQAGNDPLIRTKSKHLTEAGADRVGRVVGLRNGLPLLDDDRVLDVPNVVWCTGFRDDFSWIDFPIFDENGKPRHERGVVEDEPGLYFVGLIFQYSVTSDVLPGVGRDAEYVAKHIASRSHAHRVVPGVDVEDGAGDVLGVVRQEV
jgi:putative flavoprotein involved in K+ transport